jgi:hypothetical protein
MISLCLNYSLTRKNAEQEKQNEYEKQFEEGHYGELYNAQVNNFKLM